MLPFLPHVDLYIRHTKLKKIGIRLYLKIYFCYGKGTLHVLIIISTQKHLRLLGEKIRGRSYKNKEKWNNSGLL